ncbi:hypothetical protein [Wenxinia marina]|uniref:Uncharacterized protein n=1 Tax=Wenxinia marina DSM 24838 TaxID=1123501 RepID=A0A0D0PEB3_9RHOB|nr:hypothetical protein [Wenxinia marina]KIQ69726.1 hypothetical protein Wenmar_02090 [Wenxinia marina DSM 24838]
MAPPGGTDLKFTIYGLDHHEDEVDGAVFADKLKKLISGLRQLDKFYNTKGQHKFMIHDLEFASATVMLREKIVKPRTVRYSPSRRFAEIGAAASNEVPFKVENSADEVALETFRSLSSGAGESFSYGVVSAAETAPVRLDALLKSRVERIISAAVDAASQAQPKYFRGVALSTYDGIMKLVDIRGLFPEAKLILSAGGKEISCVVAQENVDLLRSALGRRALVSGRAQHDGRSMLPERIDVTSIKLIDETAPNIISLRGALMNLDPNATRGVG